MLRGADGYYIITRELPWLALVEVDFGYGATSEIGVHDLLEEVVGDEFLVGRVEAEPRRQLGVVVMTSIVLIKMATKVHEVHG